MKLRLTLIHRRFTMVADGTLGLGHLHSVDQWLWRGKRSLGRDINQRLSFAIRFEPRNQELGNKVDAEKRTVARFV